MGGHVETVKVLFKAKADVDIQDNGGRTALMNAAGNGRLETVKVLLKAKAKLDLKDDTERTAAQIAKEFGYKEIVHAINFEKKRREVNKKFRKVKNLAK